MKYLLFFALMLLTSISYSQKSNFERGYKEGFAKGYCHNQPVTCIGKAPITAPIPKVNESSNDYLDGYNRGFSDGLAYIRNETSSGSNNQRQEIKFNDYISQIPSNGLSILVYKEKLYTERKDWIENIMNDVHSFLTTKFLNLDADEAKKWYDLILDFQNQLGNKWPDLSENSVFDPMRLFLTNYTTSLLQAYNQIINEAEANTINYDNSKCQSKEKRRVTIVKFISNRTICDIFQFQENLKKHKVDENITPGILGHFQILKDGSETELCILYFEKYDSYQYYFKNKITTAKIKVTDEIPTTHAIASEYQEGGHGNPIFIKLSDSTCVIFDKGKQVSTNFLGIFRFKMNVYDSNGKVIESLFNKSKCWQDKVSGKKYFMNHGYLKEEEIFKDELLLTNNMQ